MTLAPYIVLLAVRVPAVRRGVGGTRDGHGSDGPTGVRGLLADRSDSLDTLGDFLPE